MLNLCHLPLSICLFLSQSVHSLENENIPMNKLLGDCGACKILVDSFSKLYSPEASRSDKYFTAIKQKVCTDYGDYNIQCHQLYDEVENSLYSWWVDTTTEMDLFTFLCINALNYCCPVHHYGKECLPCNTDLNNICGGNGKCRGDGTKKGNGSCACDVGYEGEQCNECSFSFFEKSRNETRIICEQCHSACKDGCSGEGTQGCTACHSGWKYTKAFGCVDIDECVTQKRCSKNEFCINNMGSFVCYPCDPACAECDGDGPDNCRTCATEYNKVKGVCVGEHHSVTDIMSSTRHYTYFGLASAAIILLTKSRALGAIVGGLITLYIAGAEYYCMISGHSDGMFDMKDFDLTQLFKSVKK